MSAGGKSPQLVAISSLASHFHQNVDRIAAATICELSQLIEIASFASQLNKLVNRVLVPLFCLLPQLQRIGITHGRTSSESLVSTERYRSTAGTVKRSPRMGAPDHRICTVPDRHFVGTDFTAAGRLASGVMR
jgi:hypothetical protein